MGEIVFLKMDSFGNPTKKMRLDKEVYEVSDDDFAENNDLWEEGEITAEEFDLLELQATQKLLPSNSNLQIPSTSTSHLTNGLTTVEEVDSWKKQLYALEGKIKLLNDSLDKSVRELNKERLEKVHTIEQKTEEFEKKQRALEEEIEKLQTCLHFKEQEMKHTQSKVLLLEQKLEAFKKSSTLPQSQQVCSNGKSPQKFLNRFQFDKSDKKTVESSVQTEAKLVTGKKYHLSLVSARGERKGFEVMSDLFLSRKQSISSTIGHSNLRILPDLQHVNEFKYATTAFARLNANQESEELWYCYDELLKRHINYLQSDAFADRKYSAIRINKIPKIQNNEQQGMQHIVCGSELENYHELVMQCLKDLNQLLLWRAPQLSTNPLLKLPEQYEQMYKPSIEQDIPACSAPLFSFDKTEVTTPVPLCLLPLLSLANNSIYPESYSYKREEFLLALRALVSWSSRSPSSMEPHVYDFPFHSIASGQYDIPFALLALQLLTNLIHLKGFTVLLHQRNCCILTSIAGLCHIVKNATKEQCELFLHWVENFLSTSAAVLGTSILQNENCQCSSQIVQGFILMLFRHWETFDGDLSSLGRIALHEGIVALCQLSAHVKNFKEKRVPVEGHYIMLICALSRLTKENVHFRYLSDSVRELWDFQDENGEFDTDESSSSNDGDPCTSNKNKRL